MANPRRRCGAGSPARFAGPLAGLLTAVLAAQGEPLNPSGAPLALRHVVPHGSVVHALGEIRDTQSLGLQFAWLHYARSLDGGRSWPERERLLAYANGMGAPATDGERVYLLAYSFWLGPYVAASADRGATFGPWVRVSQQTLPRLGERPFLMHAHGGGVAVVWSDAGRAGRLWANHSADGGQTWQAFDTRLDVGRPGEDPLGIDPLLLLADGARCDVLWRHYNPTADAVCHQRSLDGGRTWWPAPRLLPLVSLQQAVGAGAVLLAASRDRPAQWVRSADGGDNWQAIPGPGVEQVRSLAADGGVVLVCGQRTVPATPPTPQGLVVELSVSTDAGASWLPVPFAVPEARQNSVQAHVQGDAVFAWYSFADSRQPRSIVVRSDDLGVSWRGLVGDPDLGLWPAADRWLGGSALGGVYVRPFAGHFPLGGGSGPDLQGRGLPTLGRSCRYELRAAPPLAPALLLGSFAPALPQPFLAGTLWLQAPMLSVPLAVDASGAANFAVAVPTAAALGGTGLVVQAFAVDAAAPGGCQFSGAVETWVR